jgi:urease accessory protein
MRSDAGVDPSDNAHLAVLLLLADGRFPTGGHAHSGGFEPVASLEGLDDVGALERFLVGRLHTVGAVAAAFAAAACSRPVAALDGLNREFEARTPSPVLRAASRRLGRQILRAGRIIWPHPDLDAAATLATIHQPIAFGVVAAAAGLGPGAAALATAHDAAIGPATAAVRLLGLDPFAVHATLARLAPQIAAVADRAGAHADTPAAELPASSAPRIDIAAEAHATWEVRLFAS